MMHTIHFFDEAPPETWRGRGMQVRRLTILKLLKFSAPRPKQVAHGVFESRTKAQERELDDKELRLRLAGLSLLDALLANGFDFADEAEAEQMLGGHWRAYSPRFEALFRETSRPPPPESSPAEYTPASAAEMQVALVNSFVDKRIEGKVARKELYSNAAIVLGKVLARMRSQKAAGLEALERRVFETLQALMRESTQAALVRLLVQLDGVVHQHARLLLCDGASLALFLEAKLRKVRLRFFCSRSSWRRSCAG